MVTGRAAPRIGQVATSVYEIPTDGPEADGTLAWSSTTLVLVQVSAGGQVGTGYTYAAGACAGIVDGPLAAALAGRDAFDVPGSWEAMVRAIRNLGRPGLASCAISAVDTALWDLKARLLGVSLSRLLGRAHEAVPIYGSGGFTTYDDHRTRAQLDHWVHALGIPRVKIKIGESRGERVARDLHRVALARAAIGETAELYVDANGAYGRKQAIRVGRALAGERATWFEEPVSSDDHAGLALVRDRVDVDVAAGEYGYDLAYFRPLVDVVDCVQIDVTRCGGITEWLRIAALAAAHNLQVSGHCAPQLHAHVAAAAVNLRHLEYFHDHVRIEALLFDGVLEPRGGALVPDQGRAGNGLELRSADAERFRTG
ncbi:mandelate racemase [Pseudactinotalea sp. HY158]|nr:mandelate racemase [Pseudactinotalea sp. HY158]